MRSVFLRCFAKGRTSDARSCKALPWKHDGLQSKARELLAFCGAHLNMPSHDWWLYQVISACGGEVHYDPYPSVRYRQHAANLISTNVGWTARMRRLWMLEQGRFRPLGRP